MAQSRGFLTYQGVEIWRHTKVLQWTLQIVSGIIVVVLVAWFFTNIATAVQDREIPHGWSFLDREYQTPNRPALPPLRVLRLLRLCAGRCRGQHGRRFSSGRCPGHHAGHLHRRGAAIQQLAGIQAGHWSMSSSSATCPSWYSSSSGFTSFLPCPRCADGYILGGGLFVNNRGISIPFPEATAVGPAIVWALLAAASIAAGWAVYRLLLVQEVHGRDGLCIRCGAGSPRPR